MRIWLLLLSSCAPFGSGGGPDPGQMLGERSILGTLVLSEVRDTADGLKYVELCNRSEEPQSLSGLLLERFANGSNNPSDTALPDVLLPPGQAFVIAQSGSEQAFEARFERAPDAVSSVVSGNGDDVYRLTHDGSVRDLFGEVGVDGSGTAWDYTDSGASRRPGFDTGAELWSSAAWSFAQAPSPGDCDTGIDTPPPPPPPAGTLLLSEVMDYGPDAGIKYVEICNRSDGPKSLSGWALHRYANGSTDPGEVELAPVVLQAGDAWVLANPTGEASFEVLYGFSPDQSSGIVTGNGDDGYALVDPFGAVTDLYGTVGVDGTNTPWAYQDSAAERRGSVYGGAEIHDLAEWVVTANSSGSPGRCGESVVDPDPDTGIDGDGDGFSDGVDCDDSDATVFPGATERCDGIDNDCTGLEIGDEDADGDGVLDCALCEDEGLWSDTIGLSGASLRSVLDSYASNGQSCGWDSSRRQLFGNIDNVGGTVTGIYTGATAAARFETTSGALNTEHTWPQADGASSGRARCDLHHLHPAHEDANQARANFPFGTPIQDIDWQMGDARRGRDGNGDRVFEPPDNAKGNIARSLLYMHITYGFFLSSDYKARMKSWHALDPVDPRDRERTLDIADWQGKVNPLVACPQVVERL